METIKAIELRTKNYILEMKDYQYIEENINSSFFEIGHFCVGDYEEILKIIYCVDGYERYGGHCRLIETNEENHLGAIFVDKFFYDNFMKNNSFKICAALFVHELGHFINGDLLKDVAINSNSVRIFALSIGKVMPEESAADLFAVKEIGKSNMINAIDKLISVRRKRNDKGMELAIKEFTLRKDAIKKIR